MPIKRGPDGTPVDIPTQPPRRDASDEAGTWTPNRRAGSLFPDEPATEPPARKQNIDADRASPPPAAASNAEPRTVIHGGYRRSGSSAEQATPSPTSAASTGADPMENPPAGWLVVVDGPGKGSVLTIGHGQNSMGRSSNERICLDFGDAEISRSNHAVITYDPRGRRFYVQQGSGTNLVYIGDMPVLTPMPLENHAELQIGNTRLRFIALCGAEFSWQDT